MVRMRDAEFFGRLLVVDVDVHNGTLEDGRAVT